MGKCSSKKKKADPEDPPYGVRDRVPNGKVETDGDSGLEMEKEDASTMSSSENKRMGVTMNINATNVTIGRDADIFKVNSDPTQFANNKGQAKVLSQPLLKEVFTPSDDSKDGQLVTGRSATSNQDSFCVDTQCIQDRPSEREKEIPVKSSDLVFGNVKSTETDFEDDNKDKAYNADDQKESATSVTDIHIIERQKTETTSPRQTDRYLTNSSQLGSLDEDGPLNKDLSTLMNDNITSDHCSNFCSPNTSSDDDTLHDSNIIRRSELKTSVPNSSEIFGTGHTEQQDITGNGREVQCKIGQTTPFSSLSHQNATSEPVHLQDGNAPGERNILRNTASNDEGPSHEDIIANQNRSQKSADHQNIQIESTEVDTELKHVLETPYQQQLDLTTGSPDEDEILNQNRYPQSTDPQETEFESPTSINEEDGLSVHHDVEQDAAPIDAEFISQDEEKNDKEGASPEMRKSYAMRSIEFIAYDLGKNSMEKNLKIALAGNNEVKISNGGEIGSTARNLSERIKEIAVECF